MPERLNQEPIAYRDLACVHAVCEDYRASVSIDMEHTRDDKGKLVSQPLYALWGGKGTVGEMFDVVGLWKKKASNVHGQSLPCGHLIQEEAPEQLLAALRDFLVTA